MRIGNRVTRKDAPEIEGTIISIDGRRARIYWSSHFSQLVDLGKLTLAARIHAPRNRKGETQNERF
jgi:hypothetical protein